MDDGWIGTKWMNGKLAGLFSRFGPQVLFALQFNRSQCHLTYSFTSVFLRSQGVYKVDLRLKGTHLMLWETAVCWCWC